MDYEFEGPFSIFVFLRNVVWRRPSVSVQMNIFHCFAPFLTCTLHVQPYIKTINISSSFCLSVNADNSYLILFNRYRNTKFSCYLHVIAKYTKYSEKPKKDFVNACFKYVAMVFCYLNYFTSLKQ